MAIKVGSLVKLKLPESRAMIVIVVGGSTATCVWHSDQGVAQHYEYPYEVLDEVKGEAAAPTSFLQS